MRRLDAAIDPRGSPRRFPAKKANSRRPARRSPTWRGVTGAAVGGLVGLFFGLPGVIIGPFIGALLFELVGGYQFKKAAHAGLGATLGLFAGVMAKCVVCTVMIGVFTVNVIWRS